MVDRVVSPIQTAQCSEHRSWHATGTNELTGTGGGATATSSTGSHLVVRARRYRPLHVAVPGIFEVLAGRPTPRAHSYHVAFRGDLMAGFVKRPWLRIDRPGRTNPAQTWRPSAPVQRRLVAPEPYAGEAIPGGTTTSTTRWRNSRWWSRRTGSTGAWPAHERSSILHDRTTGEPYVGVAHGDVGIWHRLCQCAGHTRLQSPSGEADRC